MPDILDFYARCHAPFIHARGRAGTAVLLKQLRLEDGRRVLELGFGTGQTLVEIAARYPGCTLHGLETAPAMMTRARKRIDFCGLGNIELALRPDGEKALPYPSGFFDAVYAESVFAIMSDSDIPETMRECHRILRSGGVLVFNESLWREGMQKHTMLEINKKCVDFFGIPQASCQYAFPEDWAAMCMDCGFKPEMMLSLLSENGRLPAKWSQALALSRIYTLAGKMKRLVSPSLRRQAAVIRLAERQFAAYGPFLEGMVFRFRKE